MNPLSQSSPEAVSLLLRDTVIPQEVPELLSVLISQIGAVLEEKLLAIYVRGSLATGDFDSRTSDVDFCVVTDRRIRSVEFAKLAVMHNRVAQLPNRYALDLEGSYIDSVAIRRFTLGERFPNIFRGERLNWYEHDFNWVLERWMMREKGIILYGPDPTTLIDPISADDLRAAVRFRLPSWDDWANHPSDPEWHFSRNHKAYVVETMCRALYVLDTGVLESKPRAVAWALTNLPEPWRTTVERSRYWHGDETVDTSINEEVMRFIKWTGAQGG